VLGGENVVAISNPSKYSSEGSKDDAAELAKNLGLESGDALRVRVRGDGRRYSLNLYVLRPQVAFSYRATVTTTTDEWVEVTLPLDSFVATSFGRVVKDAGPVDPQEVNALGVMMSDKQAGPFNLEIEWIKEVRAGK
jgi:monofunctional biosynthetic peptidoglycan transglycosylase